MRRGGVRTALAGLEAAAVPTGACDPEAARQADSASLPGSLLFLLALSPPFPGLLQLLPCLRSRRFGAFSSHAPLQPGAYQGGCLGGAGKCVSEVRFCPDKWLERGREGSSALATGGSQAQPPGNGFQEERLTLAVRVAALGALADPSAGSPVTWGGEKV